MYTIDTNVVVYVMSPEVDSAEADSIFESADALFVSTVTELELFSYSELTTREAGRIEVMLQRFTLLDLDSGIARTAAYLRRTYGMKTPDSAIAATALFTGSTLVTRNVKDFQKVKELEVEKV